MASDHGNLIRIDTGVGEGFQRALHAQALGIELCRGKILPVDCAIESFMAQANGQDADFGVPGIDQCLRRRNNRCEIINADKRLPGIAWLVTDHHRQATIAGSR